MSLFVYNTLSRKKEDFLPINGKKVNMFVCGQTVYDDAHIGHAKTYIAFAVIARWLRHMGYEVKYAQNITDVDDKIINRAKEENKNFREVVEKYTKRFFEDMDSLGIRKDVNEYPKSSDYIDVIRMQIQMLIDKGYAYLLEGDVYYDVSKFSDYTHLSGMKLEELVKHRIEPKAGKRNVYDFSLWKAAKAGEPSWEIELKVNGEKVTLKGRPGWHIEDTAMTYALFGPQYDLHGGAQELIFPHHTNEIAQAEAAFGVKPFVKYWLHSGVVTIKGVKMSKSLKNFIKIRDFVNQYGSETLKMLVLSTHYRKEIDYDEKLAINARNAVRYLYSSFSIFFNAKAKKNGEGKEEIKRTLENMKREIEESMNDDFNTPLSLAAIRRCVGELRNIASRLGEIDEDAKSLAISQVLYYSNIFGIFESQEYKKALPKEAMELIEKREKLRKEKKFEDADKIREELKNNFKVIVEDTEYGPIWYY
ncbi:MAG: cysteine--tRNA ligase [Candidatus Micrarchaeaceae archaeon]